MPTKFFHGDEVGYSAYLENGPAFVCNVLRGGSAWVIHLSTCKLINISGNKRTTYEKVACDDLDELIEWATKEWAPEVPKLIPHYSCISASHKARFPRLH